MFTKFTTNDFIWVDDDDDDDDDDDFLESLHVLKCAEAQNFPTHTAHTSTCLYPLYRCGFCLLAPIQMKGTYQQLLKVQAVHACTLRKVPIARVEACRLLEFMITVAFPSQTRVWQSVLKVEELEDVSSSVIQGLLSCALCAVSPFGT